MGRNAQRSEFLSSGGRTSRLFSMAHETLARRRGPAAAATHSLVVHSHAQLCRTHNSPDLTLTQMGIWSRASRGVCQGGRCSAS